MPIDKEKKAWPIALKITAGVNDEKSGLKRNESVAFKSPVAAE